MIDGLKPYDNYKGSEMPWLGKIPVHWQEKRAKYFYREVDERSTTGEEELLSVSHKTGVTPRPQHVTMFKSETNIGHKVCRPGDLAINTMWAFMGALGVARQTGVVSPSYGVYRLFNKDELLPDFVDKLLRTENYKSEFLCRSTGIQSSRLRLYPDEFLRIPLLSPPSEEQAAIVRFLDHIDNRIQRYIRAKSQFIALLNEQKQAIIHQVVTHGLDPNGPTKPCSIDGISEVPEHWGVARLRNVVSMVTSGSRGWSRYAADEGPLFLRIANLQRGSLELRFDDVVRLNVPDLSETKRSRVCAGDLLISITAYIGSIAVVPVDLDEAYVSQHVARCVLAGSNHNPRWIGYVLLSELGQQHGRLSLYGGTKDGLSLDDVRNYPILLPPRPEQDELVRHIEEALKATDSVITKCERQIASIRDFRTRLIADVVTGKLDVRDAEAQLEAREILPINSQRSAKQPNKHFYRSVLAAEIVARHQGTKRFGRIKLQKSLVLTEYDLQLSEIQSDLTRAAAGPFDNAMMRSIESQLKKQKWFEAVKTGEAGTQYRPLEKAGGHRSYFERYWGKQQADFDRLMALIRPMKTIQAEIVATLYMAWNDLLIDGKELNDERLVEEVFNNWHPKKQRIERERWQKAIQWMRDNSLVPSGFGAHTKQQTKSEGE